MQPVRHRVTRKSGMPSHIAVSSLDKMNFLFAPVRCPDHGVADEVSRAEENENATLDSVIVLDEF